MQEQGRQQERRVVIDGALYLETIGGEFAPQTTPPEAEPAALAATVELMDRLRGTPGWLRLLRDAGISEHILTAAEEVRRLRQGNGGDWVQHGAFLPTPHRSPAPGPATASPRAIMRSLLGHGKAQTALRLFTEDKIDALELEARLLKVARVTGDSEASIKEFAFKAVLAKHGIKMPPTAQEQEEEA